MKTIAFFIFGFGLALNVVGSVQNTSPAWNNSANYVSSLPPGEPGFAPPQPLVLEEESSQQGANSIAEAITPEIQALARGLENDPLRIFCYVHDHIRHVLYFGSKKGAQLTLMEQSGNDFDQCALLMALLQAAGYTNAQYKFGQLEMPYDSPNHLDLHHWLELGLVNTNWTDTKTFFSNLLPNRGYPNWFDEGNSNTIAFDRVWVTLNVGGTNYYLDPAFKVSEPVAGINLPSAMGLNTNTLWLNAGGTDTADYVQNVNEANLRTNLAGLNNNLLATLQTNYPNASVLKILGGQQIMPWTNGLSQLNPPFPLDTRGGVYPELTWTNEPTSFMASLTISFGTVSTNIYFPQLQGRRLSLTFGNNLAQLWLDDMEVTQYNTSGNTSIPVTLEAKFPYGGWSNLFNTPFDDNNFDHPYSTTYNCLGSSYALIYCFEPDIKYLQERQSRLAGYLQMGLPNTSRQVVTETLETMGLNWMIQTKLNGDILAQLLGCIPQYHVRLGRMAQESNKGYYVDIYDQQTGTFQNSINNPSDLTLFSHRNNQWFDIWNYFSSSMEHGLIEQLQDSGLVAASTVKILQLANARNQVIYLASITNWMTGANVSNHIAKYNDAYLSSRFAEGYSMLMPTNGAIPVAGPGSWNGESYVEFLQNASRRSMAMTIDGQYNGGYIQLDSAVPNTTYINLSDYSVSSAFNVTPIATPAVLSADPVNMSDASFRLTSTDISTGTADPLGTTFTRYYSPTRRQYNLANLGNGWVHSYYVNLQEISDPEPSLGSTTPAQMAPMLVADCAAIGVYTGQFDPKIWLVTALISKWGVDQITSNAVSIAIGNDTLEFIREPGGIYIPPANCTWSLTNRNSNYLLQQRHGNNYGFNPGRQLVGITNQSGDAMSFFYSGTTLSKVTDFYNRTLTFSYSGPTLTKVSDSAGRSVSYGYTKNKDGNYDLTSMTDPEGKASTCLYDTNHQLIASINALQQLVVSNLYDSFGRVTTQFTLGDTNRMWQIYWSGWETVAQDPTGSKQRYFYDDQNRLIGQQDALGNASQIFYDGQNHTIATVSPLNETNQSIYDGNNNVICTIDSLGFSNQFVYDNQNNLVKSIDARGNTNSYGYDADFRLIGQTNGAGNWLNFTYNANGSLYQQTDPAGTTTYAYDKYGGLSSITYPSGLGVENYGNDIEGDPLNRTNCNKDVTVFQYNNRRQITNTISPLNHTNSVGYDNNGKMSSQTDARRNAITYSWSATGHLLETILPQTPQGVPKTFNNYDVRDWLTNTVDALNNNTYFYYDPAQHLVATLDPLSRITGAAYDPDGHQLRTTNGLWLVSSNLYDARGSVLRSSDPTNRTVAYVFDGAGNQIILTNRNKNAWLFQYDAANRLTNTVSPLGKQTAQAYNSRGLLALITKPSGHTNAFFYDARGRLTNETDNVGNNFFQLDPNGNTTNLIFATQTNTWTYNSNNLVTAYTDINSNLIQYGYDACNNLTNLTYPGGKKVAYAYDSQNRLTNVLDWGGRKTSLAYDLNGHLTSITRPNGTVRLLTYDAAGQAATITEKTANGSVISYYKYAWDHGAKMQWEYAAPQPHAGTVPSHTMSFNNDDQLINIDGNTVVNDADGNMTSGPLMSDSLSTYTYDARNRLLNVGGVSYGYDASANRLAVTNGANPIRYVINPNSTFSQVLMRIQYGVTNYYVYGAGLLYQVTEAATGTNTFTYHYDSRGSTVALTDGNGNVTDRIEYSAYATTTYRSGTNDTPFLFNGNYGVMTDPNGLLYMRARYYNPYICRFLNPDPSGFAGGLNMYAFADGNPISMTDPFGLGAVGDEGGGPSWLSGVGQVWQGYGNAAAGLLGGLWNTVAHPINTLDNLGNAIANPAQTGQAIWNGIGNTFNNLTGPDPLAAGQAMGNILIAGASVAAPFAGAGAVADVGEVGNAAETTAATSGAENALNGVGLNQQLSAQSAFNASGGLSQEAITGSEQFFAPGELGNPAIPQGFGKYTTPTFDSPSGPFQVHFYQNPTTGEIWTGLDYKTVFNNPF